MKNVNYRSTERFQFQTGSIKSVARKFNLGSQRSFNSKLVQLEVRDELFLLIDFIPFQFQTGSIRSLSTSSSGLERISFNSKLVRLEGFPNTALILYCTLTVPVKLIFHLHQIRGSLLSTSNRAKSLRG